MKPKYPSMRPIVSASRGVGKKARPRGEKTSLFGCEAQRKRGVSRRQQDFQPSLRSLVTAVNANTSVISACGQALGSVQVRPGSGS